MSDVPSSDPFDLGSLQFNATAGGQNAGIATPGVPSPTVAAQDNSSPLGQFSAALSSISQGITQGKTVATQTGGVLGQIEGLFGSPPPPPKQDSSGVLTTIAVIALLVLGGAIVWKLAHRGG